MALYWNRKRSFRKIGRFLARDQNGTQHTLVQRIERLQSIGVTGLVVEVEHGISCFYSATSGDVVLRQVDGSFVTENGKLKLLTEKEAATEIIAMQQLDEKLT
jgi:hypothetical protein